MRSDVVVGGIDSYSAVVQVVMVLHRASDVAVPVDTTNCVAVHMVMALHVVAPARSWYVPVAHVVQLVRPETADIIPAGHT